MSEKTYDGPTRVGQLRPSQLIHSFGIGGLIDLPHLSVIVNGLQDWDERRAAEVTEERLLNLVRQRPGMSSVRALRRPPWIAETQNPFDDWARVGVPVAPFPRWMRCPWGTCQYLGPIDDGQYEKTVNPYRPDQAAYVHTNCRKKGRGATGLPVRFMLVCERGHLDEFPWVDYVHRRNLCSAPLLEMFERGLSAGPADVFVRCRTCSQTRPMSDAFGDRAQTSLPACRARHPHLGTYDPAGCDRPVRALLLGASNAWFPAQISALSIPAGGGDAVPRIVDELWQVLEEITDEATLGILLRRDPALGRLADFETSEVWAAVNDRRSGVADQSEQPLDTDVLGPEWHQFIHPENAPDTEDFRLSSQTAPPSFSDRVESVVQVERLREVVAFTGFTRLSSPNEASSNELAPLSRYAPTWVPAVEIRGEGIFIRVPENTVGEWAVTYSSTESYEQQFQAHKNWRNRRGIDPMSGWPGARYILLHTLSHMLMREFALDCGYASSSIRERIYSRSGVEPMAGLLLYTAAPDSEGTLGGLVSLGTPDRLGRLLTQALDHATICTSDPTCAEHVAGELGDDHLHAAACHACLFASETSCERGNRYLDRAAVVGTVTSQGFPYFKSPTST